MQFALRRDTMGLSCWSKPVDEPAPDRVSLLREASREPRASEERKGWVHEYRKLHVLGMGSAAKVRLCERAELMIGPPGT